MGEDKLREATAKKAQKAEIQAKAKAKEKTTKSAQKENNAKHNAAAEKRVKKMKKLSMTAGGDPCDTCLKKCKTYNCRTYCNAHWCGANQMPNKRKELFEKLHKAKKEQGDAEKKIKSSKKHMDATIGGQEKHSKLHVAKKEKTAAGQKMAASKKQLDVARKVHKEAK